VLPKDPDPDVEHGSRVGELVASYSSGSLPNRSSVSLMETVSVPLRDTSSGSTIRLVRRDSMEFGKVKMRAQSRNRLLEIRMVDMYGRVVYV